MAGVLTPSQPIVESNRYVVPVYLSEVQGGVTALDFRLDYDASAFRPVSVEAGASTLAAGKMVNSNSPEPGAYRVVVMGLNQDPIPDGEVARLVLERIDAGDAATRFAVSDPTLALADGSKEAASGGGIETVGPGTEDPDPAPAPETPEPVDPSETVEEPAAAPDNGDVLSEDVTAQVMDGVLGALSPAPGGTSVTVPGAVRVSGEEGGEKLSIRNRKWALPAAPDSGIAMVTKERQGETAPPESASPRPSDPEMGGVGAIGTEHDRISSNQGGENPENKSEATAVALNSPTVESVGEAADKLQPAGIVREPSAGNGWARTVPVLSALVAAAGAIALAWYRLKRAAR